MFLFKTRVFWPFPSSLVQEARPALAPPPSGCLARSARSAARGRPLWARRAPSPGPTQQGLRERPAPSSGRTEQEPREGLDHPPPQSQALVLSQALLTGRAPSGAGPPSPSLPKTTDRKGKPGERRTGKSKPKPFRKTEQLHSVPRPKALSYFKTAPTDPEPHRDQL